MSSYSSGERGRVDIRDVQEANAKLRLSNSVENLGRVRVSMRVSGPFRVLDYVEYSASRSWLNGVSLNQQRADARSLVIDSVLCVLDLQSKTLDCVKLDVSIMAIASVVDQNLALVATS